MGRARDLLLIRKSNQFGDFIGRFHFIRPISRDKSTLTDALDTLTLKKMTRVAHRRYPELHACFRAEWEPLREALDAAPQAVFASNGPVKFVAGGFLILCT